MQDNNCGKLSGNLEFVQIVGDGGCHASVTRAAYEQVFDNAACVGDDAHGLVKHV
jgi:hypothetical protein